MTFRIALRALARNKLRSFLTMLGIIIGVGAVIAMVAIGEGAKATIRSQIASLGTNVLIVLPGTTTQGGVRVGFGSVNTLTDGDSLEVEDQQRAGGGRDDGPAGIGHHTLGEADARAGLYYGAGCSE